MHIVYGFFGNLYYVLRKYMRGLGGFFKNREFTPTGRLREASGLGEKCENGRFTPMGRLREASRLGQKCLKQEDYSKRKKGEKKMVETEEVHMYNRVA